MINKRLIALTTGIIVGLIFCSLVFSGADLESPLSMDPQWPAKLANVQSSTANSDAGFVLARPPRMLDSFAFLDPAGQPTDLKAFRGKIVLLNVWATWCAPCRMEIPALDRMQGQLGGKDFEVIALSIDRSGLEAVQRFYAENRVTALAVYLDPSGRSAHVLGATGLPATFLIDRKG